MPSEKQQDLAVGSELCPILAQDNSIVAPSSNVFIHLFLVRHHWSLSHNDQKKHSSNTTTSLGLSPRWKFAKSYLNLTGVALSAFFFSVIVDTSGRPGRDASLVWWPSIAVGGPVAKSKIIAILTPILECRWLSVLRGEALKKIGTVELLSVFEEKKTKTHIEWWFMCLCGTWDEILTELSSHRSKLHLIFCKVEEDESDEESLPDPIPTAGKKRRQFWRDLVLLGDAQKLSCLSIF